MSYIEGESRDQAIMFPEVIDDYIEKGNPVRIINIFVEGLNLAEYGFKHARTAQTGRQPYNPGDLLMLYMDI